MVRRLAETEAYDVGLADAAALEGDVHLIVRGLVAEIAPTRTAGIQDGGGSAEGEVTTMVRTSVGAPRGHGSIIVRVLPNTRFGVDAGEPVGGVDRDELVASGDVAVPGGRRNVVLGNAVELPFVAAHVHGDGA